jgi:lysophospholipase L1-like esterase
MALAAIFGGTLMPAESVGAGTDPKEARLGDMKADRVLFLGNSITLHGPAPHIGWSGNWGMAASALEKDYVHLLLRRLSEATGRTPEAMIQNLADFERNYPTYDVGSALKKQLEFNADLVIVAIGENVPAFPSQEAKDRFSNALASLLAALKKHGNPAIFVRSCFWPDKTKDEVLRQVCREAGATFVDISRLAKDESHYARSERKFVHAGVAAHPGDKGMRAIADALWEAIARGPQRNAP